MLIVCCKCDFCHCAFLLTSVAGSLVTNHEMDVDQNVSCVNAVVNSDSMVKVVMIWQMTVFLIRIPRRSFGSRSGHAERKCIVVCLCRPNVIVDSGFQWMITCLKTHSSFLQKPYIADEAGEPSEFSWNLSG